MIRGTSIPVQKLTLVDSTTEQSSFWVLYIYFNVSKNKTTTAMMTNPPRYAFLNPARDKCCRVKQNMQREKEHMCQNWLRGTSEVNLEDKWEYITLHGKLLWRRCSWMLQFNHIVAQMPSAVAFQKYTREIFSIFIFLLCLESRHLFYFIFLLPTFTPLQQKKIHRINRVQERIMRLEEIEPIGFIFLFVSTGSKSLITSLQEIERTFWYPKIYKRLLPLHRTTTVCTAQGPLKICYDVVALGTLYLQLSSFTFWLIIEIHLFVSAIKTRKMTQFEKLYSIRCRIPVAQSLILTNRVDKNSLWGSENSKSSLTMHTDSSRTYFHSVHSSYSRCSL